MASVSGNSSVYFPPQDPSSLTAGQTLDASVNDNLEQNFYIQDSYDEGNGYKRLTLQNPTTGKTKTVEVQVPLPQPDTTNDASTSVGGGNSDTSSSSDTGTTSTSFGKTPQHGNRPSNLDHSRIKADNPFRKSLPNGL